MMQDVTDITKRYVDAFYKLFGERRVGSKREFCQRTNTYSSNFRKMELGLQNISLLTAATLIEEFNVSADWLLFGTGEFRCEPQNPQNPQNICKQKAD